MADRVDKTTKRAPRRGIRKAKPTTASSFFEDFDRIVEQQRSDEEKSNRARFLRMRSEDKTYWRVDGTRLFWLTEEQAAERRAEATTMAPAMIQYETRDQECGTPWKEASVEDVDAMMAAGDDIILHGC